nr:hypothetical protein EUGRSUZ_B00188 [Ipomoea batatas]GME13441.1 hypothetical protein EUGRSUZ_B00188 [Ipomoea batatas]
MSRDSETCTDSPTRTKWQKLKVLSLEIYVGAQEPLRLERQRVFPAFMVPANCPDIYEDLSVFGYCRLSMSVSSNLRFGPTIPRISSWALVIAFGLRRSSVSAHSTVLLVVSVPAKNISCR